MAAQKPAKTDLENIDASGFVLFTADFHSDRMFSAAHHNGIVRAPASVFGSQTTRRTPMNGFSS